MADPGNKLNFTRRDFVKTVGIGVGALQAAAIGVGIARIERLRHSPVNPPAPQIVRWPIAKQVYTTAEQQVCPVALSPSVRRLHPGDVALYSQYKYSAWTLGALQHLCARILRRITPGRPMWLSCCTTSPSPTFISPTRSRRRSRST